MNEWMNEWKEWLIWMKEWLKTNEWMDEMLFCSHQVTEI